MSCSITCHLDDDTTLHIRVTRQHLTEQVIKEIYRLKVILFSQRIQGLNSGSTAFPVKEEDIILAYYDSKTSSDCYLGNNFIYTFN
jgi:hypothetical protein